MLSGIFYVLFSVFSLSTTSAQCCFVNPSYSGVCIVDPASGETCASILDYLNSAGTVGKSYCGNTTIRGGWQEIRCQ